MNCVLYVALVAACPVMRMPTRLNRGQRGTLGLKLSSVGDTIIAKRAAFVKGNVEQKPKARMLSGWSFGDFDGFAAHYGGDLKVGLGKSEQFAQKTEKRPHKECDLFSRQRKVLLKSLRI